MPEKIDWGK